MRKMIKTVIVLALVAAMLCSSAMAATVGAKVLATDMTVYTSSKTVAGTLPQGTSIAVTDMSGDWLKIYYKGYTGYAHIKDVAFTTGIKAVANQDTALAFVTKASYSDYTYYKATLSAGTGVYVVGKRGNYALITNSSGSALGYVAFSALTKV